MRLSHSLLCRAEIVSSVVGAVLFVLSLVDPQWIERWFAPSPDNGQGSAERWMVAGCFLVATLLAAALAWRDRRRLAFAALDD